MKIYLRCCDLIRMYTKFYDCEIFLPVKHINAHLNTDGICGLHPSPASTLKIIFLNELKKIIIFSVFQ